MIGETGFATPVVTVTVTMRGNPVPLPGLGMVGNPLDAFGVRTLRVDELSGVRAVSDERDSMTIWATALLRSAFSRSTCGVARMDQCQPGGWCRKAQALDRALGGRGLDGPAGATAGSGGPTNRFACPGN